MKLGVLKNVFLREGVILKKIKCTKPDNALIGYMINSFLKILNKALEAELE